MIEIDNDRRIILEELYTNRFVDVYQIHRQTKIPPTTLFNTLEGLKRDGLVSRQDLIYSLTETGEHYMKSELGKILIKPSLDFKSVPDKFSGIQVSMGDVSIISNLVR